MLSDPGSGEEWERPDLAQEGCAEAGRWLLGSALSGYPDALNALTDLAADDLTDASQRALLEVIQDLQARDAPIDLVTVLGEIKKRGDQFPLPADRRAELYLHGLLESARGHAAGYYKLVVLENKLRRVACSAGTRIELAARSHSEEAFSAVVDSAFADIQNARERLGAARTAARGVEHAVPRNASMTAVNT
jgi:replicative DNA helicase